MTLFSMAGTRVSRLAPLFLLAVFFLAACLPAEIQPLPTEPLATETPAPEPTHTIVWFPPTATFTPAPIREMTPTPELRFNQGQVIFTDDFTDREAWQVQRSAAGSVAYGQEELTLAVAAPRGLLVSFRNAPSLGDFYLEIEAEPSLCRGADAYGLLLRAHSNRDLYRLLINCLGEVRFERISDARSLPLKDWTYTGVPPGGMIPVRLGVWALKNEMRVFVNDSLLFIITDRAWSVGQIGIFARSAGDTPLTVSFSRLAVYALEGGSPPLTIETARPVQSSATPTR